MNRFFKGLRCTNRACGMLYSDGLKELKCEKCGNFLEAYYDLDSIASSINREDVSRRPFHMWRYREVLPVRHEANVVTLCEGGTPLIKSRELGKRWGLPNLYFKDETRNPTGSFKDRGASVTLSKCREVQLDSLVISSSGNAAAAFSAYAAIAQKDLYILLRTFTDPVLARQSSIYGATTLTVRGTVTEANNLANEICKRHGWFNCAVPLNLYRVEGKKTQAYEIAEQLKWHTPDRVICPTGGGTNMIAIWKGFQEMREIGWISRTPAMIAIQPSGCAPIVKAYKNKGSIIPFENPSLSIPGLSTPYPAGGDTVLKVIEESGGLAEEVTEEEIIDAEKMLADAEGIFAQAASAAGIAGLKKLVEQDATDREEIIVCIITGSGKNDPHNARKSVGETLSIQPNLNAFDSAIQSSRFCI